jgi:predicted membrane chloride channel (bestrophin family)
MAATAEQGRVPYGEESRKYRRTEFSHNDWVNHRTTQKRIVTNLNGLFFSGIVRQLKEEIILVALAATVTVLWNDFLLPIEFGANSLSSILPRISLPSLPFTLCSPALGLLLVFKTNASYARWSEARNTWAKIVSQARNVVRMAATFAPQTENGLNSIHELSNAVWLLCRSLMNDLSGPGDEEDFRVEIIEVYSESSLDKGTQGEDIARKMIASSDRSMAALAHASRALDNVPIDEKRRVEIDKSLVIIGDCIGTCEKIYSSPVPLVCKCFFLKLRHLLSHADNLLYSFIDTRHTGRFLSLWMILLPAAMYDAFVIHGPTSTGFFDLHGLALIPATAILGLFLFGIDELAIQLEEPFSILPLQKFCDRVRKSTDTISYWLKEKSTETTSIENEI